MITADVITADVITADVITADVITADVIAADVIDEPRTDCPMHSPKPPPVRMKTIMFSMKSVIHFSMTSIGFLSVLD